MIAFRMTRKTRAINLKIYERGWSESEGIDGKNQRDTIIFPPTAVTSTNEVFPGTKSSSVELRLVGCKFVSDINDSNSSPLRSVVDEFQSLFLALASTESTVISELSSD